MPLTESEELELLELEEEEAKLAAKPVSIPPVEKPKSYLESHNVFEPIAKGGEGLISDFGKRAEEAGTAWGQAPDPASGALQVAGKGAQYIGDVAGRVLGTGAGIINKLSGETLGQAAQEAGGGIGSAIGKGMDTGVGRSIVGASEEVKKSLKNIDPNVRKNIEAGVNIAATFIPAEKVASAFVKGAGKTIEGVLRGGESALKNTANRIENTSIKLLSKESGEGANIESFGKYDLFGSPKEVHVKSRDKITELVDKLDIKLKAAADEPENNVNISGVITRAKNQLVTGRMSDVEKNEMLNTFNRIAEKIESPYLDKDGIPKDVNLLEAQLLKRYTGKYGDWLANPGGGMRPSVDATNESKIYNTIYDVLKKELEDKGGAGIKEINKQLSEIIPIERAAGKRVLVSDRKNPISLDDYIGGLAVAGSAASGNIAPLAVMLGNVASKSPVTARGLYGMGKGLGKIADIGAVDVGEQAKSGASSVSSFLKRSLGNESGAVGGVKNNGPLYHGGRNFGEEGVLSLGNAGRVGSGQDAGAVFVTPSKKYASGYVKSENGRLYEADVDFKKEDIFDATNPKDIARLAKHVDPQAISGIKETMSHGAADWATLSQFSDEIEQAGFTGAKFLERPAENIDQLADGSFKLSGNPVYSYGFFHEVPAKAVKESGNTGLKMLGGMAGASAGGATVAAAINAEKQKKNKGKK